MHFNLSPRVQLFHSGCYHINLLVYLYFLNSLIDREMLLLSPERVPNSNGVLALISEGYHLLVRQINKILLDGNDVFNKLLFSITFNVFDALHHNCEQVFSLSFVACVLTGKEIYHDFEDMWLQQRNYQENTVCV